MPSVPGEAFFPIGQALSGKRLLLTGATGFIGKVILAMLLDRRPDIGRVFVLVRPRAGKESQDRFFESILASPAFDPLRARMGPAFDALLREKVEVVCGDLTKPRCGLSDADLARLTGLDLMVNIAGLVSLNPALDDSLEINGHGAQFAADLAVSLGAGLVHMSTAYASGLRSGDVREDENWVGYYPRRGDGRSFDARQELADCDKFIADTHQQAQRDLDTVFLEAAMKRRAERARKAGGEAGLAQRLAKRWVEERFVVEGRKRAVDWGWPNIYCYTKAIGEQLIATTPGLRYTIVRPSIVESALAFPMPGWNEGMTTSAPVILAMVSGHALWPAHSKAAIDMIPVDQVAAATIAACGALLLGKHEPLYHLSSADTNPFPVRRCMKFVGEYRDLYWRDHASDMPAFHWLRTRLPVVTVPGWLWRAFGVPAYRKLVGLVVSAHESFRPKKQPPKWLQKLERELTAIQHVVETFYPFIHDLHCVFKTDKLRALYAGMPAEDRAAFPWAPESMDWRGYWFDIHTEGLRRWVFPGFQPVPKALRARSFINEMVRGFLDFLQARVFDRLFRTAVYGRQHIPKKTCLVVGNHASHLDMGMIKFGMGPAGRDLVSLAAKDYFFDSPLRRWYFSNFTNLLPINRKVALRESLQLAGTALQDGRPLLIFPEGTRSRDGRLSPFRPSVGFLALTNKTDVLPVYLEGAFDAMPKGSWVPKRRDLAVHFGPVIAYAELAKRTEGMTHNEACRAATTIIEAAVRELERQALGPIRPDLAAQAKPPRESLLRY